MRVWVPGTRTVAQHVTNRATALTRRHSRHERAIENISDRLVSVFCRKHGVEALVQFLPNPNQNRDFSATQFTHQKYWLRPTG